MHAVTYTFNGEAEPIAKAFADEASADLFIGSLTTRRDAWMFTNIAKTDLVATQTARCLGCGEAVGTDDQGRPLWTPHGTCRSYYGAGNRVDYDLWLAIVANDDFGDRPYFDRWASAEPMRGVPSWFDMAQVSR